MGNSTKRRKIEKRDVVTIFVVSKMRYQRAIKHMSFPQFYDKFLKPFVSISDRFVIVVCVLLVMATSLFDEPPSIASFQDYPMQKPFLNSNVRRSENPTKAYPENSSEAVLSALKGLQDKIRNLELDRSKAEKNLKALAAETSAYKNEIQQRSSSKPSPPSAPVSPSYHSPTPASPMPPHAHCTEQIESQLRNADTRCVLLERQLDNMRRMVQNAERERSDALERQIAMERDRGRITAENRSIQSKLEKMEYIQGRFDDLNSRKEKSEARIKELEEQLKEESHHRKLLADRAAQMQTAAETKRILKPKKTSKQKPHAKRKVVRKKFGNRKAIACPAGRPHYRLNLADVPFVAGTSTSPSHAVSTNMQRLLHDLKHHNPLYCNEEVLGGCSCEEKTRPTEERGRRRKSTEEDLNDLLCALQDEFGKLAFDHQVLSKQVESTCDREVRNELTLELDALVTRMERKGDQITTVKRHLAQERRHDKRGAPVARSCSGPRENTVTLATRLSHSARSSPRSRPGENREKRLAFLRDMQSIRSALHRDDLSWE